MRVKNNKGISVITVIIIMLLLSVMGTVLVSLVGTSSDTSIRQMKATQAQSITEGGIEYALYQYKSGTACASLAYSNVSLGAGSFTTTGTLYNPTSTTLSGAINNAVTTIPLTSATGYAPHGRVTIDSETIDYSGVSGNSLTGARRGANNSTTAAHSSGASVVQNLCMIQSTGTVTGAFGNPTRVVETAAQTSGGGGSASSAFYDSGSVAIGTSATTLGTLATSFAAGDNLIIAVIAFRGNTNGTDVVINAGNLKLVKSATTLASNVEAFQVGPLGTQAKGLFSQETQFLLYKDTGAAANPTYSLTVQAQATGLVGEVKMIAIHGAPNSSFQTGSDTTLTAGVNTTLLTHNSTVPAGDNVILAAVDVGGDNATIAAGGLQLMKGATSLSSNQISMTFGKPGESNMGTGYLLMARDAGASANPTYSVTCLGTNKTINGAAQIIVLNGLSSAYIESGSTLTLISNSSLTTIGTLPTTFSAGEMVAISSDHVINDAGAGQISIVAGNQQLVAGATSTTSQFQVDLCSNDVKCANFPSGLLLRLAAGAANQSFLTKSQASAAGLHGESKILAISLVSGGLTLVDWREVFP